MRVAHVGVLLGFAGLCQSFASVMNTIFQAACLHVKNEVHPIREVEGLIAIKGTLLDGQ